ncbi:MAG: T9SS type A sorting domain-containing protein [Bacteroidota bacterium]|nr:T9SS type A sorting domain-containing protein [Bacteroidota bacterium]
MNKPKQVGTGVKKMDYIYFIYPLTMKRYLLLTLFAIDFFCTNAQCQFQHEWDYRYPGFVSPLTLEADKLGKPFLYAASNEFGLKIFDLSGTPVLTLDTNLLQMRVMSFTQRDTLLYVAIGSHYAADPPGLAIVNVADPANASLVGYWIHPVVPNSNGSGIVKVEGNYAYLGGMKLGLVILNILNPSSISFVSELPLNINYPANNPSNIDLYNVRGMEVRNSIAYVCFDAGGFRVINCTDKFNPVETGRYANPITFTPFNLPRAYNNVVLNDTVVYVSVDYCGLEVLNIKDTSNIVLLDHYNPHNCPVGVWHDAPVHTNEMVYRDDCKKLFIASGKSEMLVVDVSDPTAVDSCGSYGSVTDTTATWGIGMHNDSIFLSYLIIPVYISWYHPFDAKWNGIKMIKWQNPCSLTGIKEEEYRIQLLVYPNPSSNDFNFEFDKEYGDLQLEVYSSLGTLVKRTTYKNTQKVSLKIESAPGMYFVKVRAGEKSVLLKLVKTD